MHACCAIAHLLAGRAVQAEVCLAVLDGHLHQLHLRAVLARLVALHPPLHAMRARLIGDGNDAAIAFWKDAVLIRRESLTGRQLGLYCSAVQCWAITKSPTIHHNQR